MKAYAKINLTLDVIKKRPDGYHDISSIKQQIDLADEVKIKLSKKPGIECENAQVPQDETNLCMKAFRLLESKYPKKIKPVTIFIEKNIPLGGGLAGGSTDAATTLKLLNEKFKLGLSLEKLMELGAEIGSDVPFCLFGGTAHATGRGEVLIRIKNPIKNYFIVVICPKIHVSTEWAYGEISNKTEVKTEIMTEKALLHLDSDFLKYLHNDFEKVVFKKCSEVSRMKEKLRTFGAPVLMSGSGSSIFGIFENERKAKDAIEYFGKSLTSFLCKAI